MIAVYRVLVAVGLALGACGRGNPAAGAVAGAPASVVVPPPIDVPPGGATLRVVQRTRAAVPGTKDTLEVQLGDITGGRVTVIVTRKGEAGPLATGELGQGDSLGFAIEGHSYAIAVETLENVLVGDDAASLRLTADAPTHATTPSPVLDERARIEALLARVRVSGIVFIRNGSDHTAEEAAKHLGDKWSRAGDRITTAEEFIEQLASRSSQSGEAYRVRLPDGTEREAGPWLREQLAAQ